MVKVAVLTPSAVGANCTVMLHEPWAGIDCPVEHVPGVALNGALACTPVITSGCGFELVTVTCWLAGG